MSPKLKPPFTEANTIGTGLDAAALRLLNALWFTLPEGTRNDKMASRAFAARWCEYMPELEDAVTRAEIVADAVEATVELYIRWYESEDGFYHEPIFENHTMTKDSKPPADWDVGPLHVDANGVQEIHAFDWA